MNTPARLVCAAAAVTVIVAAAVGIQIVDAAVSAVRWLDEKASSRSA